MPTFNPEQLFVQRRQQTQASLDALGITSGQQVEQIQSVGATDVTAAAQQAIDTTVASNAINQEAIQTTATLQREHSEVLAAFNADVAGLREDETAFAATVYDRLSETNSNLDEDRAAISTEIQDELGNIRDLNENTPRFWENPLGNLVGTVRQNFAENRVREDRRELRSVDTQLTDNRNQARRLIIENKQNVTMVEAARIAATYGAQQELLKAQATQAASFQASASANQTAARAILDATRAADASRDLNNDEVRNNRLYQYVAWSTAQQTNTPPDNSLANLRLMEQRYATMTPAQKATTAEAAGVYTNLVTNGIEPTAEQMHGTFAETSDVRTIEEHFQLTGNRQDQAFIRNVRQFRQGDLVNTATANFLSRNNVATAADLDPEQQVALQTVQEQARESALDEAALTAEVSYTRSPSCSSRSTGTFRWS